MGRHGGRPFFFALVQRPEEGHHEHRDLVAFAALRLHATDEQNEAHRGEEREDGWWAVRVEGGVERPLVRLGDTDEEKRSLRCAAERCVVQQARGFQATWSLLDPQTGALSRPFYRSSLEKWLRVVIWWP